MFYIASEVDKTSTNMSTSGRKYSLRWKVQLGHVIHDVLLIATSADSKSEANRIEFDITVNITVSVRSLL